MGLEGGKQVSEQSGVVKCTSIYECLHSDKVLFKLGENDHFSCLAIDGTVYRSGTIAAGDRTDVVSPALVVVLFMLYNAHYLPYGEEVSWEYSAIIMFRFEHYRVSFSGYARLL